MNATFISSTKKETTVATRIFGIVFDEQQAPWLALWPGACLTIVVYCLNMLGDAMRDLLDPRLRGGGGRLGTDGSRSV